MSYEESLKSISLDADSSLAVYTGVPGLPGSLSPNSGFQYRFVKIVGNHEVGLCTGATDLAIGIMQNKPQNVGMAATVGIFGVSNITAGAAITAGQKVAPDSTGRAVHDDTNGKWQAIIGASVAGELIPVLRVL